MINDGRFSDIGHGVLRRSRSNSMGSLVEESTNETPLKVIVSACALVSCVTWENSTLTFHGSASTVRHLLLPLLQDWTFAALASLLSVSQVGEPQLPVLATPTSAFAVPFATTAFPVAMRQSLCVKGHHSLCCSLRSHNPSNFCTPHRCHGCKLSNSRLCMLSLSQHGCAPCCLLHLHPIGASKPHRGSPIGEKCWPSSPNSHTASSPLHPPTPLRLHPTRLPGFSRDCPSPVPLSAPQLSQSQVLSQRPLCPSANRACHFFAPCSPTPRMPCVRLPFSAT